MTNTINNVPRELLDSLLTVIESNGYAADEVEVVDELRALLSTPSPAGVDGLEVVGVLCISRFRNNPAMENVEFQLAADVEQGQHDLCRLSDAKAIIDGLLGELEAAGEILAQQGRRNTELRKMRDQHAQRIGELEGALRKIMGAHRFNVPSMVVTEVHSTCFDALTP